MVNKNFFYCLIKTLNTIDIPLVFNHLQDI